MREHLEARRVGSSMMSDVCRGLIGILRGDDKWMYWASLSLKFNDGKATAGLRAQKVPKGQRLSMCLLICLCSSTSLSSSSNTGSIGVCSGGGCDENLLKTEG